MSPNNKVNLLSIEDLDLMVDLLDSDNHQTETTDNHQTETTDNHQTETKTKTKINKPVKIYDVSDPVFKAELFSIESNLRISIFKILTEREDLNLFTYVCYQTYNKHLNYTRKLKTESLKTFTAGLIWLAKNNTALFNLILKNPETTLEITLQPLKINDDCLKQNAPIQNIESDLSNIYKVTIKDFSGKTEKLDPVKSKEGWTTKRTKTKLAWGTVTPDKLQGEDLNPVKIKGTEYHVIFKHNQSKGCISAHLAYLYSDIECPVSLTGSSLISVYKYAWEKNYSLIKCYSGYHKPKIDALLRLINKVSKDHAKPASHKMADKYGWALIWQRDSITILDSGNQTIAKIAVNYTLNLLIDKISNLDALTQDLQEKINSTLQFWTNATSKAGTKRILQISQTVLEKPQGYINLDDIKGLIGKYPKVNFPSSQNRRSTIKRIKQWHKNLDRSKTYRYPTLTLHKGILDLMGVWIENKEYTELLGFCYYFGFIAPDDTGNIVLQQYKEQDTINLP